MSKISNTAVVAFAGAALMSLAQSAFGQVDDSKLGKVHFETSCNPQAQKLFDRAMLYQHSFWYRASQKVFDDVLKADPECGIAYWGIALSLLLNPHVAPPAKDLAEGSRSPSQKRRALAPRRSANATISTRLRSCMPITTKSITARAMWPMPRPWSSWRNAIQNDDEAQIHYALSAQHVGFADRRDRRQPTQGCSNSGADLCAPASTSGVAHYLIHLYDYPPIAEKGINAARVYAKIAPDASHALHMPSHIFTRVGYWQEVDDSNVASARVAKASGDFVGQLHAMDYLVYAYLQLGQDTQGKGCRRRDDDGYRHYRNLPTGALCAGYFAGAL